MANFLGQPDHRQHIERSTDQMYKRKRTFTTRLRKKFKSLLQFSTEICAEWCSSKAVQGQRERWGSCSVASLRCGNANVLNRATVSLPRVLRELREATAWWCATGGDSGPQHGRPDGATALSDSAQFLAAGLAPALWPQGSENKKHKETSYTDNIR